VSGFCAVLTAFFQCSAWVSPIRMAPVKGCHQCAIRSTSHLVREPGTRLHQALPLSPSLQFKSRGSMCMPGAVWNCAGRWTSGMKEDAIPSASASCLAGSICFIGSCSTIGPGCSVGVARSLRLWFIRADVPHARMAGSRSRLAQSLVMSAAPRFRLRLHFL
jgi:hypothetical protein